MKNLTKKKLVLIVILILSLAEVGSSFITGILSPFTSN
jgi:hypothetical protein